MNLLKVLDFVQRIIRLLIILLLVIGLVAAIYIFHHVISWDEGPTAKGISLKAIKETNLKNLLSVSHLKFPSLPPHPPSVCHVPILMYHNIAWISPQANELQKGLTVSPAEFEYQLAELKNKGYQTISLADLFKALYYRAKLPPRSIILTFDDGYDNAYFYAFPLLKKYGFKGSFCLITDLVNQPGRLTWVEVKKMSEEGMEFVSHSKTHQDLRNLSEAALVAELEESKKALESHLAKRVYFFCHPAGKYKPELFSYLKKEGYLLALTTNSGAVEDSDHPFELPRLRIRGGLSREEFSRLLP